MFCVSLFLQEFHREGDSDTVDRHKLPVAVSARYIRFHPTQQHNWNCLRVEVYGTIGELVSLLLLCSLSALPRVSSQAHVKPGLTSR